MTARWEGTLDALMEAYLFYASDRGQSFAEGFARSVSSDDPRGMQRGGMWRNLGDRIAAMAFNAEPIYVEPDMMTVVEVATAGFKSEPLQATDLITSQGFLYLPEPFYTTDVNGKSMSTRAFLWAPVDFRVTTTREETGPAEPTSGVFLVALHRVGDRDDWSYEKGDPRARGLLPDTLLAGHVMPWAFGERHDDDEKPGDIRPTLHMLQALWRLMAQTISMKVETRGTRDSRKRAYRANFPERNILVVRLRRPRQEPDPDKEVGTVDWKVRWIVSGHWRSQWFPSLGMHRQIWVGAYAKGPEDRPLQIRKQRIFEFVQ